MHTATTFVLWAVLLFVNAGTTTIEESQMQVSLQDRKLSDVDEITNFICHDSSAGMRKVCTTELQGCKIDVNLTRNVGLLSPNAKAQYMTDDREDYFHKIEPQRCFFLGSVAMWCENNSPRKERGRAALNMCEGMQGMMIVDDVRYSITPMQTEEGVYTVQLLAEGSTMSSNVASEFDPDNVRLTLSNGMTLSDNSGYTRKTTIREQAQNHRRRSPGDVGATLHVEMLLTIDYDFYRLHGKSSVMQALSLINQAQSVFYHSSLVDSEIFISLHVVNIQVMTTPYLLKLRNLDQWTDIADAYVTYSNDWETKFWIPDDKDPEHHDIALLLTGSSSNVNDDEAMTTYKSCNEGRTGVVRYSTPSHTSAVIAHTLSLMLGMYYDFKHPLCGDIYKEDDESSNGILTDPDRLYFTECNRRDVLFYYQNPTVDCFDDSPIPEEPKEIAMMRYPSPADATCAGLYENHDDYFSVRVCPWRYPSSDCALWCELQPRNQDGVKRVDKKICKAEDEPMPLDSGVPCEGNKVCDGPACVCPEGNICKERTRRSASIHPRFYTFHKTRYTDQQSADLVCRDNVGMLLEIPNVETQALLEDIIARTTSFDYFYMGFRRSSEVADEWVFINDTAVKYFNWQVNEPNDNSSECAVMSRDDGYMWLDFSCDGGAAFICQYDCYTETEWCKHGTISNSTGTTCTCICDTGWHGDFCELMDTKGATNFEVNQKDLNYTAANTHCLDFANTKLPSVSDETSYNEFVTYLQDTEQLASTFYVDLTLVDNLWVDSNYKTPRQTFWAANEPTPGKNCVGICGCYEFLWRSVDCSEVHKVACALGCRKTDEEWCKNGDIVLNKGNCECQCWEGSIGTYCNDFDYSDFINKTILFYEEQRSGYLPPTNRIDWRANAHLQDVGQYGEDLTDGWYDAGNYVKFALTVSENVWKLAWGLIEFKSAYVDANLLNDFYDCLKWGTDFLLKMHLEPDFLYAQVGSVTFAKTTWERPENSTEGVRVGLPLNVTHPGSDVAGGTSAAFSASYLVFKDVDELYAAELLAHARDAYTFAYTYRALWSDSLPVLSYVSSSYEDDLTNAAIWLYNATGEKNYLDDAENLYTEFGLNYAEAIFSWAKVHVPVQLMLYLHTANTTYLNRVEETFEMWFNTYYTPKGLARITDNRALKKAVDMSYLGLICAKHGIHAQEYFDFAEQQIHYALGSAGRSYISGFGHNSPEKVHHQASSCPEMHEVCDDNARNSEEINPHTLWGGLIGGPDALDRFFDHRKNWAQNEAGINVSGLQSAVAALAYFRNQQG